MIAKKEGQGLAIWFSRPSPTTLITNRWAVLVGPSAIAFRIDGITYGEARPTVVRLVTTRTTVDTFVRSGSNIVAAISNDKPT